VKIKRSLLSEMLTYKRPHGSRSERDFIGRFIDTVPGMQADNFGNRYLRLGYQPSTMISCHTDTVHSDGGRQNIAYDSRLAEYRLVETKPKPKSARYGARFSGRTNGHWHKDCLGSDDATGIFVALNMIAARIPALYVFHRAEECGGRGSEYIAMHTPELVKGIDRCIAFDRRGRTDIITHQMMGRSASNTFALALADALGMHHAPCPLGTFTDSANYADLIPECTNVSVGYSLEHTSRESQNWDYLEELVDSVCTLDFSQLPAVRPLWDQAAYVTVKRSNVARYGHTVTTYSDEPLATVRNTRAYLDRYIADSYGPWDSDNDYCSLRSQYEYMVTRDE